MGRVIKLESISPTLRGCTRLEKFSSMTLEPSRLTPELKELIDRVVVPILVKSYLETLECK